jgi:seryl-tRNA synthetase
LKYIYRSDIVDRNTLEQNFKAKFEALNRVRLSDNEFLRLREEIIEPDVFAASELLRERQYFQREDGTPLHYTLVRVSMEEIEKNGYILNKPKQVQAHLKCKSITNLEELSRRR